jgi:hypothetical protein
MIIRSSEFWDMAPCSLLELNRVLETTLSSETSVGFQQATHRYIVEDKFKGYIHFCGGKA